MRVMPTVVNLECSVRGCGERFSIPVVYRLEHDTRYDLASLDNLRASAMTTTRVVVDVDATLDLEAPLRVHLDEHACNAETTPSPTTVVPWPDGWLWPDEPEPTDLELAWAQG